MTFYLRPPSGTTHLHSLEKSAITRLNFLIQLDRTSGDPVKVHDLLSDISLVEESDCLIDGTRRDRISHYILRLAFSGTPELSSFLSRAENLFFEVRFLTMESKGITKLLHSLDVYLKTFGSKLDDHTQRDLPDVDFCLSEIIITFRKLLHQFGSWQVVVEKYLSGCQSEFIQIPFTYVLDLVRKRSVTLTNGMASLPVAKLRLVVMALYGTLLNAGLSQAKNHVDLVKNDVRMRRLFAKLHRLYREQQRAGTKGSQPRRQLNHTEVDSDLSFFPPCMSHLHSELRQKHRLKHHSRIQYTLFLKEIGLPVHEAMMFWKKEYSLVSGDKKTCSHNWLREEQRYTYNIRHLYGLEGSKVNYRGHCCQSLQEKSFGHQEEGGCPFVRFDRSHMTDFLQSENISSYCQDEVLKSIAKGDYQDACKTYLLCKSEDKLKTAGTSCTHSLESILIEQNISSNGFSELKVQEEILMNVDETHRVLCKPLNEMHFVQTIGKTESNLKSDKEESESSRNILCGFDNSEHFFKKEVELEPCLEERQNVEKIKSFQHRHSTAYSANLKPQVFTHLKESEVLSENYKLSNVLNRTSQALAISKSLNIYKPLDFYNSLKLLQNQQL